MKLFGAFEKVEAQDDGTVKVFGYASSEAVDSQGEVVKADAMRAAMPDYLKFGAVREMHKNDAAGTAIEMEVKDDGRTWFGAHVVDPIAVKKVNAKVYKGFSIGGKVTSRDGSDSKVITGLNLTEISLVDRPANPEATFALFKADGVDAPEPEADATASEATTEATDLGQGAPADSEAAPATPPAEAPADASPAPDTAAADADKAAKPENIAKSMYGVAEFAQMLQSLQYIAQDAEWERSWEQDGSPIPAQLRAWVSLGAEILVAMTKEETDELVASLKPVDEVAMAAGNDDLEKKGARNSKSDQEKIQTVHDHAVALGASCGAEKSAPADDLKKLADVESDLAKVTGERDELKKRVADLEKEPAAPKGALKVLDKADDAVEVKKDDVDSNDPLALMKAAQSRPTFIKL